MNDERTTPTDTDQPFDWEAFARRIIVEIVFDVKDPGGANIVLFEGGASCLDQADTDRIYEIWKDL